jgi:hypothetical protein
VSNADIFQLFFYEAEARRESNRTIPLPVAILAPVLDPDCKLSHPDMRQIAWQTADDMQSVKLNVLPVDLQNVILRLRQGAGEIEALGETSEVVSFLRWVCDGGAVSSA